MDPDTATNPPPQPPIPAVTPAAPASSAASTSRGVLLLVAVSLAGLAVCVGTGWGVGGQDVALAAGAGMASAAVGGLVAWFVLCAHHATGRSVAMGPTLGLAVRLGVTGAGVGLAILGFGMQRKPVLFAAMFGYLVLMATESILLYRFASSSGRDTRSPLDQSAKQDP